MNYRCYPSSSQAARLQYLLYVGRIFYNHSLEQRIRYYKETGKTLSYYSQCADLTQLRSLSMVLASVPVDIERDVLRRLDRAYKNFFRRFREGVRKPGFPRFKGPNRWNSFSILDPGKTVLVGNRVRVSGIDGRMRVRNVRNFVGKIKEQRIVFKAGKWYCQLVVEDGIEGMPIVPIRSAIGIDVGLEAFATFSNGKKIVNPRHFRQSVRKLAHANRAMSRKTKGSRNRWKAVRRLQKLYARITNQRRCFAHEQSRKIVNAHQLIAVEKLNIAGMVRGRLATNILDAAWGQFFWQLRYKAESAGALFVEVNPRGTSQECSQCGKTIQKSLSERNHDCSCGLSIHRDHNAAINVLKRALGSQHPAPCRAMGNACGAEGSGQRHQAVDETSRCETGSS